MQHSGDISLGGPGGNLEIGGTDVLFRSQEDTYYSQWLTYSRETEDDLIKDLFRRGALPTYTTYQAQRLRFNHSLMLWQA